MRQAVLGVFAGLALAGVGIFWWQGRAQVEEAAPPPEPAAMVPAEDALPTTDPGDLRGPAPPEASELTREERVMLIRAIDMGGQFYSRQNTTYQAMER